ncbi:MAG: hypothetical protein MJ192_06645 [Clostridia bacterium]|nr:hypothetical protein [Clostridia bacterium]
MTYSSGDFICLRALNCQKNPRVRDLCLCTGFEPVMFGKKTLEHALTALKNGGLITVGSECADADTPVTITDAGRKALSIPFLSQLKETWAEKAYAKAKLVFLSAGAVPDGAQVVMTDDAYEEIASLSARYADDTEQWLSLTVSDDSVTFTLRDPGVKETDEEGSDPEQTVDGEDRSSLASLCGGTDEDMCPKVSEIKVTLPLGDKTVYDLLLAVSEWLSGQSSGTTKVCLSGQGGAYILTITEQLSSVRLSAAPILYNRQRFKGLRDSRLDYAQCGNNALDLYFTDDDLIANIRTAYLELWEQMDDQTREAFIKI